MQQFNYLYSAKILEVYDGDTITVILDLGLGLSATEKIRVYGIDAPEMRGAEKIEGTKSRDWLRKRILGRQVFIQTIKDKTGKYGRLLGIVHLTDGTNVNEELVKYGYAIRKEY